MFYQIFMSPQVKRWAIITFRHGRYESAHESPNDFYMKTTVSLKYPVSDYGPGQPHHAKRPSARSRTKHPQHHPTI